MKYSLSRPPSAAVIPATLFLLLATLVWWVFSPGLYGDFILDDLQNLKGLAEIDRDAPFDGIVQYSLYGISSALGRPLSLFTFALQYDAWPGDPAAFRVVAILLHMFNGVLLFLLLRRIGRLLGWSDWAALLAVSVWLLHPLQLSTVLYVVQRMVELATLFVLLGLIGYLEGRRRLADGATRGGVIWMSAALMGGMGFGVLAKESAALLPLFILVLEGTLLRALPRGRVWWVWAALFMLLPLALLSGYYIHHFERVVIGGYTVRDFTLVERLLTEPRVLFDYIGKLLLPGGAHFGYFFDDFPISRGLLEPLSTAVALAALALLLLVALSGRWPLVGFAVLWYLGGHLLESTFFALEIYFEHRNYLPIAGPVYALAVGLLRLHDRASPDARWALRVAAVTLVVLLVALSRAEARLWGDPFRQAVAWAAEKPDSIRAQSRLAEMLERVGEPLLAADQYRRMADHFDDDPSALVMVLGLRCEDAEVALPDAEEVVRRAAVGRRQLATVSMLDTIVAHHWEGDCPQVDGELVHRVIEALIANEAYRGDLANLYLLRSRSYFNKRIFDLALLDSDRAYALSDRVEIPIMQMELLITVGAYRGARDYLAKAREAVARHPFGERAYGERLAAWEEALRAVTEDSPE